MSDMATVERAPGQRTRRKSTVSATVLAMHLDVSRTFVTKLASDGVLERQGDGFNLDQCRIAYIRFLRRARQQSVRSEAADALAQTKVELARLRVAERVKRVVPVELFDEMVESVMGMATTHMLTIPFIVAGRQDRELRQRIDKGVFEARKRLAQDIQRQSHKWDETFRQRMMLVLKGTAKITPAPDEAANDPVDDDE